MRSKPSFDYSPLVANLSKENRKRADVAPAKSLKVKVKQRKLLFPKASSKEGDRNGRRAVRSQRRQSQARQMKRLQRE